MKALSNEGWIQDIEKSKIRVVRALRVALTVLNDVEADIDSIAPYDREESIEAQTARIKAWNVVCPLLVEAGKLLKAYRKDPVLGDLSYLLKECDDILRVKKEDETEEMLKPLKEKFRKLKESRKRKPGS
jgi:hypothetical protein